MNIVEPIWYLNKECPSCEQASSLTYQKCRSCSELILVCDEERITFDDHSLTDLTMGSDFDGNCTKCNARDSLRPATGEELQLLGYTPHEYR